MSSPGYYEALETLRDYKRRVKTKKLGSRAALWAANTDAEPWDENKDGPLVRPNAIHVSLYANKIISWYASQPQQTYFPSSSCTRTTIKYIEKHTNFRIWSVQGHHFIKLRYGEHTLPYPYADVLDNETGAYSRVADSWINTFDACTFYRSADRLAGKLVHNLVHGHMTRGWNEDTEEDWREDQWALSDPDLVGSAISAVSREDYLSVSLLMAAIEKCHNVQPYQDLIRSCRPGQTYDLLWRPRTKAQRLDNLAIRLEGNTVLFYKRVVNHPRELYKALKEDVLMGLYTAAHINKA